MILQVNYDYNYNRYNYHYVSKLSSPLLSESDRRRGGRKRNGQQAGGVSLIQLSGSTVRVMDAEKCDVSLWPLAAVTLDRASMVAIEGTADQRTS